MLGNRIKDLRKEKNMTQKELGIKIGVSDRTIGYYESEERFPPQDILQKLADFFNVSVDYLLGRTQKTISYKNEAEKTLDEQLDEVLKKLQDDKSALMFKGEALDDATKEALLISLRNTLDLAESMTKNKKNK